MKQEKSYMQHKRIVVDANVFIKYAMFGNLYRLASVILEYDLDVFVTGTLLKEIHFALSNKKLLKSDNRTIDEIMDLINEITIRVNPKPLFQLSPDPTDNFLFDIAIQSRCKILITDERRLLSFQNSPIEIYSLKWFKEKYPIK